MIRVKKKARPFLRTLLILLLNWTQVVGAISKTVIAWLTIGQSF